MSDPRLEKLARLLVEYCVAVEPGDKVIIICGYPGRPLVEQTYREVIRAGGHPLVSIQDESFQEIMLKEGNDDQLQHVPEPVRLIQESYDCRIAIRGSENTRVLSGVDPEHSRMMQFAYRELMEISMRRSASGELRWVGTQYPTQASAQEADMSLTDYEDFVYSACLVDRDNPIEEWRRVSGRQEKLVELLKGRSTVRLKGADIDLRLSIAGRRFINSDGRRNMPSGEIFTGPVESSAQGWVRFTYPAITAGREVAGIELTFEDGKVVKATAEKNEDFLQTMLNTDDGARYLGEFAIGTNWGIQRFTKSILFDEKIGGTVHMALGSGYPETGSLNKSSIHWDMICDMRKDGRIWVDDELFFEKGHFVDELDA